MSQMIKMIMSYMVVKIIILFNYTFNFCNCIAYYNHVEHGRRLNLAGMGTG